MECSFEDQKRELIEECKLPNGAFDAVRERLRTFLAPFMSCFGRVAQKANAEMVVSGLISNLEANNSEPISYFFELDRKKTLQYISTRSRCVAA